LKVRITTFVCKPTFKLGALSFAKGLFCHTVYLQSHDLNILCTKPNLVSSSRVGQQHIVGNVNTFRASLPYWHSIKVFKEFRLPSNVKRTLAKGSKETTSQWWWWTSM